MLLWKTEALMLIIVFQSLCYNTRRNYFYSITNFWY